MNRNTKGQFKKSSGFSKILLIIILGVIGYFGYVAYKANEIEKINSAPVATPVVSDDAADSVMKRADFQAKMKNQAQQVVAQENIDKEKSRHDAKIADLQAQIDSENTAHKTTSTNLEAQLTQLRQEELDLGGASLK